ncbi:MAG TPA: hypothetical protein VGQ83_02410 [Polyangia bacterium]
MIENRFHEPVYVAGRQDAIRRVNCALGTKGITVDSFLLSDEPAVRGSVFDLAGARVDFPPDDCFDRSFVAFIDPTPDVKWAHPAFWIFVPVLKDGEVKFVEWDLPPHPDQRTVRFLAVGAVR